MPYVSPGLRCELDLGRVARTPGELNYQFTGIILDYLEEKGLSYQSINDIIGALEQAKDEFQRRIVADYEDTKIQENGDVYASFVGCPNRIVACPCCRGFLRGHEGSL
jgi:hypothetical protein